MKRFWVLIFILTQACLELPDMKNQDGNPAFPATVEKTFDDAWGPENFTGENINLYQLTTFTKTAALYGQNAREISGTGLWVIGEDRGAENDRPYVEKRIAIIRQDYSSPDGQQKPPTVVDHPYRFYQDQTWVDPSGLLSLERTAKNSLPSLLPRDLSKSAEATSLAEPLSIQYYMSYRSICTADGNYHPRCFNLQVWQTSEPPPDVVRQRPGCEGIENCLMSVTNIKFDHVTETYDEDRGETVRRKTNFFFKLTKDAPYLARILSVCYRGLGKYKDQPFVATICDNVDGFCRNFKSTQPGEPATCQPQP